jgi:hypothetical protein
VSKKSDQGTEHGEDGHRYGHGDGKRVLVVMVVLGQFDTFAHVLTGVLSRIA